MRWFYNLSSRLHQITESGLVAMTKSLGGLTSLRAIDLNFSW